MARRSRARDRRLCRGVGSMTARMMNGVQATLMALDEAMAADPSVILFGEDVADREGGGVMGASAGLSTKYGARRVRSTPIAEQAIVGAAVGAAIAGMRPVAEIMKIGRASCRERVCQYV